MSDFIKSIDEMVTVEFSHDLKLEFRDVMRVKADDWNAIEEYAHEAILKAIAEARHCVASRTPGSMNFEQAMKAARRGAMVTRHDWNILRAIQADLDDKALFGSFKLDNYDGSSSGDVPLTNSRTKI